MENRKRIQLKIDAQSLEELEQLSEKTGISRKDQILESIGITSLLLSETMPDLPISYKLGDKVIKVENTKASSKSISIADHHEQNNSGDFGAEVETIKKEAYRDKGSVWSAIWDALELKPSFFGIGIDLKILVGKLFPSRVD